MNKYNHILSFIVLSVLIIIQIGSTHATVVNSSGQMAYWTMNQSLSNATQSNDSGGLNINLSVLNLQPVYNTTLQAYQFTNSTAKINSTAINESINSIAKNHNFSIIMWVQINGTPQFNAFPSLFKIKNSSGGDMLDIYYNNASPKISGKIYNSSGSSTDTPIVSTIPFATWNDSNWHMVGMTVDGCGANNYRGYPDGTDNGFNSLTITNCTAFGGITGFLTGGQVIIGENIVFKVREVRIWNRSLSALEMNQLYKFGAYYDTDSNVSVNGTQNQIKNLTSYLGYATSYEMGNSSMIDSDGGGTLDVFTKYNESRNNFTSLARANEMRRDANFNNVMNAVAPYTVGTFTYNYNANSSVGNMNNHKSDVKWAYENNVHFILSILGTPIWNSNNSSQCNYGIDTDEARHCEPLNYTLHNYTVIDYLDQITANGTYASNVELEILNEVYTIYWLPNGTCVEKSKAYNRYYNETYKAIKSVPKYANMSIGGGGTFYTGSACSFQIVRAFVGNFTTDKYDFLTLHDYKTYTLLAQNVSSAVTALNSISGNASKPIYITETNTASSDSSLQNTSSSWYLLDVGKFDLVSTLYQLNQKISIDWYHWTNQQNYAFVSEYPAQYEDWWGSNSNPVKANYNVTSLVNGYCPRQSTIYNYTTNNSQIFGIYCKAPNGTYYALLANKDNITHSITFNATEITGQNKLTNMKNGTNYSYSTTRGSYGAIIIEPNEIQSYQINANGLSFTGTPSTYIVNITEPNDQTFNVSVTNPNSAQYNIQWFNATGGSPITHCANLTSCTQLGNYTSSGQYNWSSVLTGENNTTTIHWLLQINETPQNISATYTPASPLSVATTATTSFTYTITNSGGISYTSTWFNNGSNITACFNSSSCNLIFSTAGSYNITVNTTSNLNNLTNSWAVTSVYTSTTCAVNNNLGEGLSRLPNTFAVGGIIITLFLIVGSLYAFNQGLIDVKSMLILCIGLALFMIVSLLFTGATAGTVNSLSQIC